MEFEESEQHQLDEIELRQHMDTKNSVLLLEDYKELIVQIRRVNLHFQQMCSIPPGELTMLITINRLLEQKKPVMVSSLGNALKLSRPAVSRMLHTLEKKGYIRRKNGIKDQRYVFIDFTEDGDRLVHSELGNCYGLLKRVAERMGEEDMKKFLHYNNKFCTLLSEEIR